jgi:hypothetical protein
MLPKSNEHDGVSDNKEVVSKHDGNTESNTNIIIDIKKANSNSKP